MDEFPEPRRLPDDISFERWVEHVFDHPVLDPQWWFQPEESEHCEEWHALTQPARTLAHLTRLFAEPAFLIPRFTRPQIDQGLHYLVSNSCSDHMFVLRDAKLPWRDRRACFDAMIPLYEKLMAPVYGDELGHVYRPDNQGLNFSCYMWWDIIPLYGKMEHADRDRIDDAALHIFEQVLKLRSEACLESVLHGLGHWHDALPAQTERLASRFLSRTDISPELREYAERAAVGAVQ